MEASSVVGYLYSGAIEHTHSFGVGHLEFFSEEVRISVNVGPNCGVGHLGHSCEVGCSGDNLVELRHINISWEDVGKPGNEGTSRGVGHDHSFRVEH